MRLSQSIPTSGHQPGQFDLIRLLAALQVVVVHAAFHLSPRWFLSIPEGERDLLSHFPGVAIFFFISGYLVYGSYERNQTRILQFYKNRALRIFPGLWLCVLCGLLLLCAFGFRDALTPQRWAAYILTQSVFGQLYAPEALQGFGSGSPNTSLWTIRVELQFYLVVPLMGLLLMKLSRSKTIQTIILTVTIGLLLVFNEWTHEAINTPVNSADNLADNLLQLYRLSVFPYLWFFLIGILFKINDDKIRRFTIGYAKLWLGGYVLYVALFSYGLSLYHLSYFPNPLGVIGYLLLFLTLYSLAMSRSSVFLKITSHLRIDLSYGIYLYHMLVINMLVQLGMENKSPALNFCLVLIVTFLLAWISWQLIEKRALELKRA